MPTAKQATCVICKTLTDGIEHETLTSCGQSQRKTAESRNEGPRERRILLGGPSLHKASRSSHVFSASIMTFCHVSRKRCNCSATVQVPIFNASLAASVPTPGIWSHFSVWRQNLSRADWEIDLSIIKDHEVVEISNMASNNINNFHTKMLTPTICSSLSALAAWAYGHQVSSNCEMHSWRFHKQLLGYFPAWHKKRQAAHTLTDPHRQIWRHSALCTICANIFSLLLILSSRRWLTRCGLEKCSQHLCKLVRRLPSKGEVMWSCSQANATANHRIHEANTSS